MTSNSIDDTSMMQARQRFPGRLLAFAVLLSASFMNLLDVTIVNVALPSIQKGLGASNDAIEWIVAGYVLVFALWLLPSGRLGDIVGKKKMFLIGVFGFTIASGLCGVAYTIVFLVAARLIQGMTAAVMTPQVMALAQVMFDPHERGRVFSFFGVSVGLATVSGPIVGGWLLSANFFDLGWRTIFLINIPVGALAIFAGARYIPSVPNILKTRNDFPGIALVAVAMFLLIFPLIEGRELAWPDWSFAMIGLAIPCLVGFVAWQRRQHRRGGAQLLPFALMKNRNFVTGSLLAMVFTSTIPGFFLCMALFLQVGFNFAPLHSGLATMPFSVGVLMASFLSGRLGSHQPKPRLIGGTAMMAIGVVWLRIIVTGVGEHISNLTILPPLWVVGLGLGVAMASMFQTILSGVPNRDAGGGAGALQAVQQLGAAFGIAIESGFFFSRLGTDLGAGIEHHKAYVDAFAVAMIYNICGYCMVILMALMLKTGPSHHPKGIGISE